MNILSLLDRALDTPPVAMQKWCEWDKLWYSPYYHLMHLLAKEASLCVELGVEKGRGIAAFASASPTVRVVGIDTLKRPELDVVLNAFSNIEFIHGTSMPAADLGQPIDVLHIDTDHSYSTVRAEFLGWQPQLADRAIVLFDDLSAMEEDVNRAFQELPYYRIRDDRLHPVCGYGVLVYER